MLMNGDPLLTLMIFIPLLGMAVVLALPSRAHDLIRWTATAFSAPPLLLAVALLVRFQPKVEGFQFVHRAQWIPPPFNIEYFVGVDGISITMIVLTALLCFLCMIASFGIEKGVKGYYALFLLLETGMLGVFCALDFFLFFVFWELMLLPMYFLIGIWGGPRREYAAIKFFLYTLLGSVLMLVTILYLYFASDPHSFDMTRLSQTAHVPMNVQLVLWTALFIGFAIKIPAFPFHTWLPDAHVAAPTAVSVILAGVLLKMGTYGFIRFSLPLLPDYSRNSTTVRIMVVLSIIGIVYGALVSLMQRDMKKLIAYSSVSHLGFCTLGIFALNPHGLSGSVIQQINHGISTGALFLIVGLIYERRHTREIKEFGGLSNVMPVYATLFMIVMLSSIGLPLLNGFIGEFTILQGAFEVNWRWAAWAVSGIVLGAAYMLWLYQRTMFGPCDNPKNQGLKDLNLREMLTLIPLILWAFWIGLYPKPFFDVLDAPVKQIVQIVNPSFGAGVSAEVPVNILTATRLESIPAGGTAAGLASNGFIRRCKDMDGRLSLSSRASAA